MGLNEFDQALEDLGNETRSPFEAALGSVADEEAQAQRARATAATKAAAQSSPDRVAEAASLGRQLGLPATFVERNFDQVKARLSSDALAQLQRDAPKLTDWLSNPTNAAIAQDDHASLSSIERLMGIGRNVAGAAGAGLVSVASGLYAIPRAIGDVLSPQALAPGQTVLGTVDLYAQPKVANPDGTTSTVDSIGVNVDGKELLLPTVTPDGRHLVNDLRGTVPDDQLESAVVDAAIAEYERTGRHLGIFTTPEASTAYAEQLHNDYAAGKYEKAPFGAKLAADSMRKAQALDALAARVRGPQAGAGFVEHSIYGGIESLGQMAPALVLGAISGSVSLLSAVGVTAGGTTYNQARDQGQTLGKSLTAGSIQGAVEVATEFIPAHRLLGDLAAKSGLLKTLAHQLAPEIIGEEVATVLQDLNEWALLPANKDKTFANYLQERPSAAAATAISTIVAVGATTAAAHGTARFVEKLGEAATASKTVQRDPVTAQAFVAHAVQDSGAETLFAPIDTFTTYWQTQGLDPRVVATELTGSLSAYDTALATGEDLAIPTAAYAVRIAPTEHNAFFANEVRLQPDQMNMREAEAFAQTLASNTEQGMGNENVASAEAVTSPVREALVPQLTAAGFTPQTADAYATLYESTFGALGERAGVDPVALFDRYGLTVTREGLDSGATPAQTSTSDAVRAVPEEAAATSDGAINDAGTASGSETPGDGGGPAAIRRVAESVAPGKRESASAREQRRAKHYADVWRSVLDAARHVDPAVDKKALRAAFDERIGYLEEADAAYQDAGYNPRHLLEAIAKYGGLSLEGAARDGVAGELRWVRESPASGPYGAFAGVRGVFRERATDKVGKIATGHTIDDMARLLSQDPEFGISEIPDLLAALEDIARLGNVGQKGAVNFPGTRELRQRAGIQLDRAWWKPQTFNQGPTPLFDTLDTGEEQARLPEAGDVRDQNIQTPTFEAPFALTSEVAKPGKAVQQTTLFQALVQGSQDKRGALVFGANRQMAIQLLAKADLSTFLHETGHFYLEVLGDLDAEISAVDPAQLADTQKQLAADYATVLDWLGVESRDQVGVDQHEQFARGFEAYLMEGRAPSSALRGVFARFRTWLTGVYRSLRGLNVQLNDDVRRVFDRLLASDDAIAQAEQEGQVAPLFLDAESAGMTEAQFAAYRSTVEAASQQARETLEQQVLRDLRREQADWWKTEKETVRQAVAAEFGAEPVYRALAAIQKGQEPDGTPFGGAAAAVPMKIDKAALVGRYTEQELAALRRRQLYAVEGGVNPNELADLFGFTSGDELVRALIAVKPLKAAVETEAQRRMIEQHGDLLLDGGIADAAKMAVFGEGRQQVIEAELRALAKKQREVAPFVQQVRREGESALQAAERERAYERRWLEAEAKLRVAIAEGHKQVEIDALKQTVSELKAQARGGAATIRAALPSADVLRQVAEARIAGLSDRQIRPAQFLAAAQRASKTATEHAARQDFAGAIQAKQQELLNLELYRQAVQAKADAQRIVTHMRGTQKTTYRQRIGKAGASYLEQIDGFADRYEFATVAQKTLDRRTGLRAWVAAQEAEGLPVELPASLLDDARRVNWREVPLEELRGIDEAVRTIEHVARLKNKLLRAGATRTFEETVGHLVGSIAEHNEKTPLPLEFLPKDLKARAVAEWFASHSKIATIARALDGFQDGGAMWEHIIQPVNEAATREAAMNSDATKRLMALFNEHYSGIELGQLHDTTYIEAIAGSLSKEARLVLAMNWGNEGNRQRIRDGRHWSDAQVKAVLETLDERDWKFVQGVWDFIDSYWPEIKAKQERVVGIAPEKVEAAPVDTRFGQFRGGYFPLLYDGRLSARAGSFIDANEAGLQKQAAYVKATTRRGHTEARAENVKQPVRLELSVLFQHVEQVIHDLSHHEMLIDVGRLLGDARVQQAIYETKGDIVYAQFKNALRDIAFGPAPASTRLEKSLNWIRQGTTVAGLAWNVWTAVQQPAGVFNGMARVGPSWVAKGVGRMVRDAASMESTARWIYERSEMMRMRGTTQQREIAEIRNTLVRPGTWFDNIIRTVSGDHVTKGDITDTYFSFIEMAQKLADIPTWLGAYEKAMAGGEAEARAVALADQAVLDSQGGGQIKDLAQAQRGSAAVKLFTNFYSYGNVLFNATAEAYGKTNFRKVGSLGEFLRNLTLLYVFPAFVSYSLAQAFGRGDDDDSWVEAMGKEIIGQAMNTMVLVREFGTLLQASNRGYQGPSGTRAITATYRFGQQVSQGDADRALLRSAEDLGSILFRLPLGQVQRSIDGFVALRDGQTTNPIALIAGAPREAK